MNFRNIFLAMACFVFSTHLHAQQKSGTYLEKPKIAFLGMFHFAGTSDLMSFKTGNLSSEKRQNEIKELVTNLEKYKPTKIVLEYPFGNNKLDSLYQLYVKGNHQLSISESQQVGFRLAKNLGHKHIYPADYRLDLPFDALMRVIQEDEKQSMLFQEMISTMNEEVMGKFQERYNTNSINDFLIFMNHNKYDHMNMAMYFQYINKFGTGSDPIGPSVVATWWERNIKIMRNIDAAIEPDDRILVLFGQGHTAILKDFYQKRSDVEYVDILTYLKDW
jgi:hypothetical protein